MHGPPGTVHSPRPWSSELLGPGEGTKRMPNRVCALCGVPENLNPSSLDLGSAGNAGSTLDSTHGERPGASAV